MNHTTNEMIRRINLLTLPAPEGTDVLYNHGLRTVTQYILEYNFMLDLSEHDTMINNLIARIVDNYLIQDPETSEEFAFNNGINDAIDIIRSYKFRR